MKGCCCLSGTAYAYAERFALQCKLPVNASVQGPLGDSVPVATLMHLVVDICTNGAAIFVKACLVCRVDYGHAEAAHKYGSDPRKYNVMSKKFVTDDQGHVKVISASLYTLLSTLKFMLSKLVSCNEYLGDTERDLCAVLLSKFPYTIATVQDASCCTWICMAHISVAYIYSDVMVLHSGVCGVLHTSLSGSVMQLQDARHSTRAFGCRALR